MESWLVRGPAQADSPFSTAMQRPAHRLISDRLTQKYREYLYNSFKINMLFRLSLVIEKQQLFAAMHPTSGTIFKVSNLDLREKGSREEL
jgi:hypothetical protein